MLSDRLVYYEVKSGSNEEYKLNKFIRGIVHVNGVSPIIMKSRSHPLRQSSRKKVVAPLRLQGPSKCIF